MSGCSSTLPHSCKATDTLRRHLGAWRSSAKQLVAHSRQVLFGGLLRKASEAEEPSSRPLHSYGQRRFLQELKAHL